jgi:hypothetical protein
MLTTIDNPFNPHKDFDKWKEWDNRHYHNTCEYLARIVGEISDELPDSETNELINKAMLEIIDLDARGIYSLIDEDDKTPLSQEAYDNEMASFTRNKIDI